MTEELTVNFVQCKHLKQVPIKILQNNPPASPKAWAVTQWHFWIGFCPDCKQETFNKYPSTTLEGMKFKI